MINTDLYIQDIKQDTDPITYIQVDLFKDENIELNSSLQNVNDISKTFSDFSQSFTIPATPKNNGVFEHYYNTDIDGTFNPNIRIRGYIECGSLPFKYGVIQLEDVKLKDMQPDSYTVRFFSASVNLSDRFGDDDLTTLTSLSEFDHNYNASIFDATYSNSLGEDIYYPLVTSARPYQIGTADSNDITNVSGQLQFTELRPALKLIRIIEAIETKYNFTFDREFLGRAVFGNLHMWVFNNLEFSVDPNNAVQIDFTTKGNLEDITGVTVNLTDNYFVTNAFVRTFVTITPSAGYESTVYTVDRYLDGVPWSQFTASGTKKIGVRTDKDLKEHSFYIFTQGSFEFTFKIEMLPVSGPTKSATMALQTIDEPISISANMPKIKVRDFITSLIKMFNLALVPVNSNSFNLLPLDDWYFQGNLVDITKYIDSKEVNFKRPKLLNTLSISVL